MLAIRRHRKIDGRQLTTPATHRGLADPAGAVADSVAVASVTIEPLLRTLREPLFVRDWIVVVGLAAMTAVAGRPGHQTATRIAPYSDSGTASTGTSDAATTR